MANIMIALWALMQFSDLSFLQTPLAITTFVISRPIQRQKTKAASTLWFPRVLTWLLWYYYEDDKDEQNEAENYQYKFKKVYQKVVDSIIFAVWNYCQHVMMADRAFDFYGMRREFGEIFILLHYFSFFLSIMLEISLFFKYNRYSNSNFLIIHTLRNSSLLTLKSRTALMNNHGLRRDHQCTLGMVVLLLL